MTKSMLIDAAHPEEVRVCVLENNSVEDFDFEFSSRKPLRGNIYLARVTRVEPSLQAAFVEYGGNRHGFLAFNEIHPDYYQIPVSDRRILQEAEAEEASLAAALDLDEHGEVDADDDLQIGPSARRDEDGPDFRDRADQPTPADENAAAANVAEAADDDEPELEEIQETANAPRAAGLEAREPESVSIAHEPYEMPADAGDELGDPTPEEPTSEDDAEDREADAEQEKPTAPIRRSARRGEILERYKEARRKRARLLRNYKIQEVVKRRQILLIQVVKEERGNKGAALTTYLSLAGRYCVLMPNTARGGGISRKIPVTTDRKRLRRVVDGLNVAQGMGLIIRTAGANRTKAEIKRDYEYLTRLWENIRKLTLESIAPFLIYEEANLIKRAIRDLYDKDIDIVMVEGDAGYREAKDFMKMLMPSHAKNVQHYKEKTPLFLKYNVESQLDAMYQPTVRLKSGGYIVIHQTEALVAIDVNSGKATRERNIELTALKTNLEAAKEAARQCRLRDLAGLIVIDFIDMEENKNNRSVEKRLKDSLKLDRARIQIGRISNFGLLEMSRQRRRSGLVEGTTHSCPTCAGAGVVRSSEMASLRILRAIESQALQGRAAVIQIKTSLDVALYILNHKRAWLKRIEDDYALQVELFGDNTKAGDQYEIEKVGPARAMPEAPVIAAVDRPEIEAVAEVEEDEEEDVADSSTIDEAAPQGERAAESDGPGRRRRRRRRRRRDEAADAPRPSEEDRAISAVGGDAEPVPVREAVPTSESAEGESQKRRRRRGRRGGRRNNRRPEHGAVDQSPSGAADDHSEQPNLSAHAAPIDLDGADDVDDRRPTSRSDLAVPAVNQFTDDRREPAFASSREASAKEQSSAGSDVSQFQREAEREPEVSKADETPPHREPKPHRKGWWQRAIGG
ncbi:MAG: ribonuclease E/G [Parvularculaceae bacterium]